MVDDAAEVADLKAQCTKTVELSHRQACDVELIVGGAFSPVDGFMNEETYHNVVDNMRLPESNLLFGLPLVMDTRDESISTSDKLLMTYQGKEIAVMDVEDTFLANKPKEVKECYGTSSLEHPGVQMVAMERGPIYLGGGLKGLANPDRPFVCDSAEKVRSTLPAGKDVVAFQCRNPIHRAHYELFMRALDADNVGDDAVCLVHPTCGPTQADDISGEVRYLTYEVLKKEIVEQGNNSVMWAYLPYSMHMAGPREAIQHILIRKNFGCTHFIIGRDMAGSKSCLDGEDFYGAFDAQEFAMKHGPELNMKLVPSANLVYTKEEGYILADQAKEKGISAVKLSGTEFRRRLRASEEIPEWFAFKSVVDVLRESVKNEQ
jgi:sulfate adenylyltransferase